MDLLCIPAGSLIIHRPKRSSLQGSLLLRTALFDSRRHSPGRRVSLGSPLKMRFCCIVYPITWWLTFFLSDLNKLVSVCKIFVNLFCPAIIAWDYLRKKISNVIVYISFVYKGDKHIRDCFIYDKWTLITSLVSTKIFLIVKVIETTCSSWKPAFNE